MWRPLFERQQRDKDHHLESEKTDLCVVAADVLSDPRGAFRCRALQRHQDPGGLYAAAARRSRGAAPTAVQDSVLTYTIYVHRDDYDRAFAAIQSSLAGGK